MVWSRLVAIIVCLLLPAAARAAGHLGLGDGAQRCNVVTMEADDAACNDTLCHLEGNARLRCDALTLWADSMDVHMAEEHRFAGAVARGHVLLVEGVKVVTCKQIVLDQDRVQGVVDAATIEVRRSDAAHDPNGVPLGGNQAVMHGSIERLDAQHLRLTDADFTLCDCGPGAAPSWRLDTSEVQATVGERVVLWGPQVRINVNPFGELMVPITPPLAPLSLPLQKRAMGFLMLKPTFFAPPWPTLDLPFFVPLGDSFDVTVTPGIRTDWGTHSDPFKINTVGAPRLGLRLRWAPWQNVRGSANFQLTHDTSHVQANLELLQQEGNPWAHALYERRIALVDRIAIDVQQQAALAPNLDWILDMRWVSDDLVLRDFSLAVNEQFTNYWPSRSQVLYRLPNFTGLAAADFMLRFDNSEVVAPGVSLPAYGNGSGPEAGTLHRGPALLAQLAPTPLVGGLNVDASLSFVRYGTWSGQPVHLSPYPSDPLAETLSMGGATLGLGYADVLGPLHLALRTGLDSLLSSTNQGSPVLDTAWLGSAEVALHLAGRPGNGPWVHTIRPTLQYRSMAGHWLAGTRLGTDINPPLTPLDERSKRRIGHQAMALVRQALWAPDNPGMPALSFDIGQPVDLLTQTLLQPWAELQVNSAQFGSGRAFTSVDLHQWNDIPVREVGVQYNLRQGPVELAAQYDRLADNADRFSRSLYELAAPYVPLAPPPPIAKESVQINSTWAHSLSAGITLRYRDILEVGYSATYQLPKPGQVGGEPACATPQQFLDQQTQGGLLRSPQSCFVGHALRIVYRSPCNCWGVTVQMSAQAQNFRDTIHFSVVPDIAGYHF